ncbi:translation initiation factor eIF4E [Apophysomyces ossiformis]|uniref:Translation initiation factor eIF4E n=1 Tax=Apophysomyces ossiformis TaxID=679940 RepID=A0A8H7C0D8_9FUNG|nr:translation initiation factor eIF4E [Apophysomyces ossiformis]
MTSTFARRSHYFESNGYYGHNRRMGKSSRCRPSSHTAEHSAYSEVHQSDLDAAVTRIQSEYQMFAPVGKNHTLVHMPAPCQPRIEHRRCHQTNHPLPPNCDPLETTTREPLSDTSDFSMVVKKPRQQPATVWRGEMSGHRPTNHHYHQGRGERGRWGDVNNDHTRICRSTMGEKSDPIYHSRPPFPDHPHHPIFYNHPFPHDLMKLPECEEDMPYDRRASTTTTLSSDTTVIRRFSSASTTSSATSSSGSIHLLEKNDTIKESETVTGSNDCTSSEEVTIQKEEEEEEHEEEQEETTESSKQDEAVTGVKKETSSQKIEASMEQQQQQHQPTATEANMHGTIQARCTSTTMHDALPTGHCDDEAEKIPIWADPIKVRENPTRYGALKKYLREHDLSFSSPLPLPKSCTFYFSDTSAAKRTSSAAATSAAASNYIATVKPLFDCHTVRDFSARWRLYKERCNRPSQLLPNQNLYCFRTGVEPMWEDKVNRNGGRLTLCPSKTAMDEVFEWILCSFVGGNLYDHGLVGLVLARRARGDRIELWLDDSASQETMPALK